MSAWLPEGGGAVLLVHDRTSDVIASSVEIALTRRARRVGLLGRTRIDTTAAMVLAPCFAIHTAFMRFPIDVLFVDHFGRVLRVVHALEPWRAAMSTRAYAVIELAAGVLRQHGVETSDRLHLAWASTGRPGPLGPGCEAGPKGPALRRVERLGC